MSGAVPAAMRPSSRDQQIGFRLDCGSDPLGLGSHRADIEHRRGRDSPKRDLEWPAKAWQRGPFDQTRTGTRTGLCASPEGCILCGVTEQPDTRNGRDRHASALHLAEELLTDIELSRCQAQQAVLKASRLARLVRDEEAQVWLGYELYGYPNDSSADTEISLAGRWSDADKGIAFRVPLARLLAVADAEQSKLQAMQVSSFGGDRAFVAVREHQTALNRTSERLGRLRGVVGSVISMIHAWVTRIYHELLFSDLQAELFASAQSDIDSRLAPLTGSALAKIESVSERLRDGDPESVSQAMSTCRRLIDATADVLFPPREEPYRIGEVSLSVKQNNVLNRLQSYVAERVESKGRRDRLRRTLSGLYDRTSTGTHTDVDVIEARYLFLNTYVVLGELITLSPPKGKLELIQ